MRQSVSLVTLGVSDYGRAKAFYEALGWSVAWEAEETSFFQAERGCRGALEPGEAGRGHGHSR